MPASRQARSRCQSGRCAILVLRSSQDIIGACAQSYTYANLARAAKPNKRSRQIRRRWRAVTLQFQKNDNDRVEPAGTQRSRIDRGKGLEARRNIPAEIVQHCTHSRCDQLRIRIAQHRYGHRGTRGTGQRKPALAPGHCLDAILWRVYGPSPKLNGGPGSPFTGARSQTSSDSLLKCRSWR